jgi:hypothetical protein
MKHLNVKWMPETAVAVSFTVAASQNVPELCGAQTQRNADIIVRTPVARRIVISGGKELHASVMTAQSQV